MQLVEEDNHHTRSIIDLTGNNKSVAEFVDLTKDPEVIDLCSATLHLSSSSNSKLMSRNVLQDSDNSVDSSDISSGGTGGHQRLPHPRLIGTVIKFNHRKKNISVEHLKKGLEVHKVNKEEGRQQSSVQFFLAET